MEWTVRLHRGKRNNRKTDRIVRQNSVSFELEIWSKLTYGRLIIFNQPWIDQYPVSHYLSDRLYLVQHEVSIPGASF